MNLREAAQQALEALEVWRDCLTDPRAMPGWRFAVVGEKAIENLRVALAEDAMQRLTDVQQEMDCYGDGNVYRGQRSSDSKTQTITINGMPAVEGPLSKAHRISQESRQVEPVAWSYTDARGRTVVVIANTAPYEDAKPLYYAPPKRKPISTDMILATWVEECIPKRSTPELVVAFARAIIERAHGIGGEE